MTAEISLRDDELTELLTKVTVQVEEVKKSADKQSKIGDIQRQLNRGQDVLDMFRMEMRSLDHDMRTKYRKKFKEHKKRLEELKNDLEWTQDVHTRDELIGDAAKSTRMDEPDINTSAGLMEHGRLVQKDGIDRLTRTAQAVTEAKQIGEEVAVKLEEQRQQIEGVYNDLYEIDDMVERSLKIMKRMMRRTMTNKYMWCIIGLIFFGIIFIIVWKSVGEDATEQAPDSP